MAKANGFYIFFKHDINVVPNEQNNIFFIVINGVENSLKNFE